MYYIWQCILFSFFGGMQLSLLNVMHVYKIRYILKSLIQANLLKNQLPLNIVHASCNTLILQYAYGMFIWA